MTMKSWVCSIASIACGEIVELGRLVVGDQRAVGARDAVMRRQFEIEPRVLRPGAAVLDVMGEAFLPRVEIDRGDALARLHQRDRDMHRDRGFARPALFVAEHDDVRRSVAARYPQPTWHSSRGQVIDLAPACGQA